MDVKYVIIIWSVVYSGYIMAVTQSRKMNRKGKHMIVYCYFVNRYPDTYPYP